MKVTGEYKARGLYAVAVAPTVGEAVELYREYMRRLGYVPTVENPSDDGEGRIALLTSMLNAPYSKGGRTTSERYTAEEAFAWRSKGGKNGKRGPARKDEDEPFSV